MKNIIVLDYGIGNVRSVCNAFRFIGSNAEVSSDKLTIMNSDGLVIPGVGAFPRGMANLIELGLDGVIRQYVELGLPVLGICLGMQLLFDESSEFFLTKGLGLMSGRVDIISIPSDLGRLPHIAWSKIHPTEQGKMKMFEGLNDDEMRFYFVHSYAALPIKSNNISAIVSYHGRNIVAAVQKHNIWGTQFHPEKSGPSGLRVLKNFLNIC